MVDLAGVALAIFLWCAFSLMFRRVDLTAPFVFVALGVTLTAVSTDTETLAAENLKLLAEATLVLVLFSDAALVEPRALRADTRIYLRLLALALPCTVVLGWLLAGLLVDGLDLWLALLVAASLAPTDAALGALVISHPAVPAPVRRIINVESGLNDGIVTPVVLVALAGAAHGAGIGVHTGVHLSVGALVGIVVGAAGGWALRTARDHQWLDDGMAGPALLALALLAYSAAVSLDGNGYIAAFTGGLALGHAEERSRPGRTGPSGVPYVEQTARLASYLVWFLVGVIGVPIAVDTLSWQTCAYAALSLTLVRMLPVRLVLLGSGVDRRGATFIGWFGPRGLASVVFALLAVDELGRSAQTAVGAIVTTVLLSVVAHGFSAGPLVKRYAAASGDGARPA